MINKLPSKILDFLFKKYLVPRISVLTKHILIHEKLVFNSNGILSIDESSYVANALFNLSSGNVSIGKNVSFGHNVSCLTGTHNLTKKKMERQNEYPHSGHDIVIMDGVWIGSNVTILGPCIIGENAAIAAFSLVNRDVPENELFGGVPAKYLKSI